MAAGIFLLVVGGVLVAVFRPEQLADFGDENADWVALVGAGVVVAGLVEILRGRWGHLRPPEGLIDAGRRSTARVLTFKGVGATQNPSKEEPINGGTYRIDLEVVGDDGAYRQRIFRVISKNEAVRLGAGSEVPVAVDPIDRRRIAVVWPEAPILRTRS